MDAFSLEGKVAVVTGGLGLLGMEHCRALSEAGAEVIVADLDENICREFADTLHPVSRGMFLDVTEPDSVKGFLQRVMEGFGQVDILVNNAGVNDMFENPALAGELSRFENYPLQMWKKTMDVNVTGVFLCSQIIGGQMARQGSGSIINIASIYVIIAPDQSIYRKPTGEQQFYKSPAFKNEIHRETPYYFHRHVDDRGDKGCRRGCRDRGSPDGPFHIDLPLWSGRVEPEDAPYPEKNVSNHTNRLLRTRDRACTHMVGGYARGLLC